MNWFYRIINSNNIKLIDDIKIKKVDVYSIEVSFKVILDIQCNIHTIVSLHNEKFYMVCNKDNLKHYINIDVDKIFKSGFNMHEIIISLFKGEQNE